MATGSTDKTVKLFDLRKISTALHTFDRHKWDFSPWRFTSNYAPLGLLQIWVVFVFVRELDIFMHVSVSID